jgi:hypothetical protein
MYTEQKEKINSVIPRLDFRGAKAVFRVEQRIRNEWRGFVENASIVYNKRIGKNNPAAR